MSIEIYVRKSHSKFRGDISAHLGTSLGAPLITHFDEKEASPLGSLVAACRMQRTQEDDSSPFLTRAMISGPRDVVILYQRSADDGTTKYKIQ